MRLKAFRVRDYKNVRDSGRVEVGDITCLVGKNEAGKTALLEALYRLNPVVQAKGTFNVAHDYPRADVEDYRHAVETKAQSVAIPIEGEFALGEEECAAIAAVFGPECLTRRELTICKSYDNARVIQLAIDAPKALSFLIDNAGFVEPLGETPANVGRTPDELLSILQARPKDDKTSRVIDILLGIKAGDLDKYIFDNFLARHEPKFLYFDEYYQLTGHESIDALMKREEARQLKTSDYPLLGLIRLARLRLSELLNPASSVELRSKLQGASNYLTKHVLKYWSQNRHLRMEFDVRPGRPGDPAEMRQGTNIWATVFDSRHQISTELGSRSRGFVWFFSFLAWYSELKRSGAGIVLLFDEPGLTLHAKAQADLLHYFEAELKGHHQLIYTTHSPFMIHAERLDRVRIVEDKTPEEAGIDHAHRTGSVVFTDIFAANPDSLLPIQGALGRELHHSFFVGQCSLIVQDLADLLYIQSMSDLLKAEGRIGLDARWATVPVGAAVMTPMFGALLGTQNGVTTAMLVGARVAAHFNRGDPGREKVLRNANLLTFAEFTKTLDADIEDMFGADFYTDLVNGEFAIEVSAPLKPLRLVSMHPRIVRRLEEHFEAYPLKCGKFEHNRTAGHFVKNIATLAPKLPLEAKGRFEAVFRALNALLPI